MERCPNCRARTRDEPTCPRCGLELGLLRRVEEAAEAKLRQAIALLANGDRAAACRTLLAARRLIEDPLTSLLIDYVSRAQTP